MTDQITSAAKLDALPEYSVIRIYDGADPNAAICYDLPEGRRWFTTVDAPSDSGNGYTSRRLAEYYIDDNEWGLPTLLVTADAEPVRETTQRVTVETAMAYDVGVEDGRREATQPTEEQVREMAVEYAREHASDLSEEGVGALARGFHDGVLALLPQRCAPNEDFYDEETLTKVYWALGRAGLADVQITDAVGQMQNAGILFRERSEADHGDR